MAGIGFELNKLISKRNFFSKVKGYFYTTSSCLGSMILGFVLLFIIQYVSKSLGQDTLITEIFSGYITNTIFLSMLIFGTFSLVISRYVSDLIYTKKEYRILPSFWGIVSIIIPLSIIIYFPLLEISNIDTTEKVLLLILLAEFVTGWTITLYVTILKNYKHITLAYGIAILLSIIELFAIYKNGNINIIMMLSTVIGSYGIVIVILTSILQKQLKSKSYFTYEFLKWFSKYPQLILIGFFSNLAVLIHFYIMWFSSNGNTIIGLIHNSPDYDLPAIMAYFSTLITSITFIAVLEPHFYNKYSRYFKLLNSKGNYKQLEEAKKEMIETLKEEVRYLIIKQLICTFVFVVIISQILYNLNIGMTKSMIETFKLLSIGYSLYAIANVILQLQLYFADNKGALISSFVFFCVTTIVSIITLFLNETFWGLGLVVGSTCMILVGTYLLERYLSNLEYNVLNKEEKKQKNSFLYNTVRKVNISIVRILKNKRKNTIINVFTTCILVIIFITTLNISNVSFTNKTFELSESNDILSNPGVGLAPWAENEETLNMDTTLVYIDLSWAEWEPEEGFFDYEAFEEKNHIEEYKGQNRQAIFRFYMDYPSETRHMDIPEWLYDKIDGDGTWYNTSYGKGFSPNYSNEILIEYHKKAIEAFAEKYCQDEFFIYIELGSIGHWGEWHVNYAEGVDLLPDYETRIKYITPYIENIKNSQFLMRYPIQETETFSTGLYNDMTGDEELTEAWLESMEGTSIWDQTKNEYLVNNIDTWKKYVIGGEFASSYENSFFLLDNLENTISLLKKSHQSFIGPKIIIDENDGEYTEQMSEILKNLGHRLYVKEAEIENLNDEKLSVTLNITNTGTAPIYTNVKLTIYIYDVNGNLISTSTSSGFDPQSVLPNSEIDTTLKIDVDNLNPNNTYTLCVGLENENGEAIIELAMEKYKDKIYKIGDFTW